MKDGDDYKPWKLHRKGAPGTSVAAAHSVNVTKREKLVLDAIKNAPNGLTIKELAKMYPNVPYGTLSARPTGLEEKGLIEYKEGVIREKARVMFPTQKAQPQQGSFF